MALEHEEDSPTKHLGKKKQIMMIFTIFVMVFINGNNSVRSWSSLHGNYLGWRLAAVNGGKTTTWSVPCSEDRLLTLLWPDSKCFSPVYSKPF